MEPGSELSKTVATFIVQKILSDEVGTAVHLTATAERCYAVGNGAGRDGHCARGAATVRLLKHIRVLSAAVG